MGNDGKYLIICELIKKSTEKDRKDAIGNKIELLWRSTDLTLGVCAVPSNNPDKKNTTEKGNRRENKKQNLVLYIGRRKRIFFSLPCDQNRMNSSNIGACPRFHVANFHAQRETSSKTSWHISVQAKYCFKSMSNSKWWKFHAIFF